MPTVKVGPLAKSMVSPGTPVSDLRSALLNHLVSLLVALKWFDAQGNVENYEGGRDLDALASL